LQTIQIPILAEIELSIVVPFFNEEASVDIFFDRLAQVFPSGSIEVEYI
jgi:hypothetical protein